MTICPETTVCSDRTSLAYLSISDAFVSKEYFFCLIQMIQLSSSIDVYRKFHINKQNICHCGKMCLKWKEVMKSVYTIMQCSMICPNFCFSPSRFNFFSLYVKMRYLKARLNVLPKTH